MDIFSLEELKQLINSFGQKIWFVKGGGAEWIQKDICIQRKLQNLNSYFHKYAFITVYFEAQMRPCERWGL